MRIKEFESRTGVPAKTIRYYESIDLLPLASRSRNGYRAYTERDVDRLRLVAGARRLDFSLAEIREILDLRDRGEAPCLTLLQGLEEKRAAQLHQLGIDQPFAPDLSVRTLFDWAQLVAHKERIV